MRAHTIRLTALTAIVLGLMAATPMQANGVCEHTQYLTFSRPVALPGVTLHSGTYIFEMPDPNAAHDVVRVMSRDRKIVYLTAFTLEVDRPASVPPTQIVSLHEAAADGAMPVEVWWSGTTTGRQFIYAQ
jgi:hypothetical protein